jgi:hypothetical protein
MTLENVQLTAIVGKIHYYEQLYEKYGDLDSLHSVEMYRDKAEELMKQMEESVRIRQNKLYISR